MSVVQRLLQVMAEVDGLTKDGTNEQQHYSFLSEEKVTTTLHQAFTKAGLTMRPVGMKLLSEFEYPTKSGHARGRLIECTYELADAEGDSLPVQVIGEGTDSGDKATNKAMSAALKYALRQTCMISTGEDPDKSAAIATGSASRIGDSLRSDAPACSDCGKQITGGTFGGRKRSSSEIVDFTTEKMGKPVCAECLVKNNGKKSAAPMESLAGGDA